MRSRPRRRRPVAPLRGRSLALLLDDLTVGGGTTVAASLATQWIEVGANVSVIALGGVTDRADERLPSGTFTALGAAGHLDGVRRLRYHLNHKVPPNTTLLCIGEYSALVAVIAKAANRRLKDLDIFIAEHQPQSLSRLLAPRGWPLGMIGPRLVRHLRRQARGSVCLSDEQRDALIAADLTTLERSRVILNPCSLTAAGEATIRARVARLSRGGPVRLLCIGSLNEAKNHPLLLRALTLLDERYSLTIVGGGETEMLRSLADELGVTDRVRFQAPLPDVSDIMDAHDVFVLPSKYESFGLVVIEAIVRGMPVVSTASNATLPRLAEHFTGLRIVPLDDEAALRDAIQRHSMSTWEPERLGADAIRMLARHDPSVAATSHLESFAEIVGSGCGRIAEQIRQDP